MASPLLSADVTSNSRAAELTLRGELDDASVRTADQALFEVLSGDFDRVTIDLRRLEFMDSTGVKFLIDARDAAEELGIKMALNVRSGSLVERVLGVTSVETLFDRPDGGPA